MERKPVLQSSTPIQKEGDEGKATIPGPHQERGGIIQHIHLDFSSLERLKAVLT